MTHSVTIKLAPVITADRFGNPDWERPGRTLYWRDSLSFLPGRSEVPLVIDHNMERQVGVVDQIFPMDGVDGWWICASGTITDLPCWLRRNETKASFGHWNVHASENRVTKAWVKEVSLLSPAHEPMEPLACVMSIRLVETSPPAAVRSPTSNAAVVGDTLLAPQRIVRRNIGEILRVR